VGPLRARAQHEPVAYGLGRGASANSKPTSRSKASSISYAASTIPSERENLTRDSSLSCIMVLGPGSLRWFSREVPSRLQRRVRGQAYLRGVDASGSRIVFIQRFSRETNGKLERFYSVYEQKQHQFKSVDEYVHWHNEVKPHLSLNIETLETPIQAFHRKQPLEKTEVIQTTQDAK